MKPLYYTNYEGGKWIDWPDSEEFKREYLCLRDDKSVIMGNIKVHSLAFHLINIDFARWDCVNGITDILKYFEEDNNEN